MEAQVALERLKTSGGKMTPQRRTIVAILAGSDRPLSAMEIYEAARAVYPNISFDTVYRNLNLLVGLNIASRLNLQNKYRSRYALPDGEHHHYLVCLGCGDARRLEGCPFEEQVRLAEDKHDFTVTSHAFELYGYCPACREQR